MSVYSTPLPWAFCNTWLIFKMLFWIQGLTSWPAVLPKAKEPCLHYNLPIAGEEKRWIRAFHQVKCTQPRLRFELCSLYPFPMKSNSSIQNGNTSFEKVTIFRLHIGHTRLTHSFIFKPEEQPQCIACQTCYTVKHFLIK